ncbi:MAG: hypothetical protein ACR2HB_05775 [Dehalococcoidia bacterium]
MRLEPGRTPREWQEDFEQQARIAWGDKRLEELRPILKRTAEALRRTAGHVVSTETVPYPIATFLAEPFPAGSDR